MRILVTGHLGYVGTVLVPMLAAKGHEVRGLAADLFRGSNFGTLPQRVEDTEKDIRDIERHDLVGVDAVIHLAGLSNDPLGDLDPTLTFAINHDAAVRTAELAKSVGVKRFVAASSCSVYGAAADGWMFEHSPFNPVTPYAESKLRMERDVSGLADDSFSPVFLRAATVYGLSSRIRFDLVINNLAAWACTTGEVLMKSDGEAWRPVLHVEDLARAFVAAVEAPRELVHNRSFNAGSTRHNYLVRELAEAVHEQIPGSTLKYQEAPIHDRRTYRVNCDQMAEVMPESVPEMDLANGIRQLRDAFFASRLQAPEFEGKRYQRVAHLKALMARGEVDAGLRRCRPA